MKTEKPMSIKYGELIGQIVGAPLVQILLGVFIIGKAFGIGEIQYWSWFWVVSLYGS